MIRRASKTTNVVPLTEARVRLFRLVEDLLAGRADRVALSHRGHDEEVLLVRSGDVVRMEEELAALRRRVAPEPRPLRGLGRLVGDVSVEGVIADIRARDAAVVEAKLGTMLGTMLGDAPEVAAIPAGDVAPRSARAGRRRRAGEG